MLDDEGEGRVIAVIFNLNISSFRSVSNISCVAVDEAIKENHYFSIIKFKLVICKYQFNVLLLNRYIFFINKHTYNSQVLQQVFAQIPFHPEHISITVYLSAKKKYNLEIKVGTTDLDKMFSHRNGTVKCRI